MDLNLELHMLEIEGKFEETREKAQQDKFQ
jgi:hypothetical protein